MNIYRKWGPLVFVAVVVVLSSACSSLPFGPGAGGKSERVSRKAIEQAMARVYPALVRVDIVTMEPSGGRLRKYETGGSGAIISADGLVITNHHVAGKAKRIVCRMQDGEEIEGELVGTDVLADISVLKLDLENRKQKGKPLPVAQFGDSDAVQVGDTVLAMGSPGGMTQSVTKGIVSNTTMMMPGSWGGLRLDGERTGTLVRWIGHDARIYGGNSGGPLVNLKGEIIGINEVNIAGLAGAIPGNLAKSVAEQLIETGEVKRSWTGLECQPRLKDLKHEKGVLVAGIIKDSPALKAGIEPGDILLKFDGVDVNARLREDLPIFNRLVLSTPIGKTVEIVALRGDEEKTFKLTTIAREKARDKDKELKSWGMTARNLTLMSALERKRPDKKGVLVGSMRRGGPASEGKPSLRGGDIILEVNGKAVDNVADLLAVSEKATKDTEDRVQVLVTFVRNNIQYQSAVKIGKEPKPDEPMLSRKAWLPLRTQVLLRDLAEALGIKGKKGVRVTKVFPDHSAAKAGIKEGDLLLKLDGEVLDASEPEDAEVLPTLIRQYKVGAVVEFDVMRDGKIQKIKVKLEKPPKPVSELERYKDDYFELTLREISFDDRIDDQIEEDVRGVLVEQIEPAGWASLARVRPRDILISLNGKPTGDVDTVEKILKEAREKKTKRVVFFVRRGIHTIYLEIEPSREDTKDK